MSILKNISPKKKQRLKKIPLERYNYMLDIFGLDNEKLEKAFDAILQAITEECQTRVLDNDDAMILVTGPTGTGKSTLCQEIAYYMDPDYSHISNVMSTFKYRIKSG